MFPVLVIEDEPLDRDTLKSRFKAYDLDHVGQSPHLDWAFDFYAGLKKIQTGCYPVIIVDFQLPTGDPVCDLRGLDIDPQSEDQIKLGMALMSEIKKYNHDAVVVAHTGRNSLANQVLKYHGTPDFLIEKEILLDKFVAKWQLVSDEVMQRFNYECSENEINLAITSAFPSAQISGVERRQWEICIRRGLRGKPTHGIRFKTFKGGKSGAGVVSVQYRDRRPAVLKFGRSEDLLKEFENYQAHVKDYIARNAITDRDSLYRAGGVGVLEYRLAGTELTPLTLGDMVKQDVPRSNGSIREFPGEIVQQQIKEHFRDNCQYWFCESGAVQDTDVATPLVEHFKLRSNAFSESIEQLKKSESFSLVSTQLGIDQNQLAHSLVNAVDCKRREIAFPSVFVRVHGDLNCNNLVWDGGNLCMIDYAKAKGDMPVTTDFVKLEASLKYSIPAALPLPLPLKRYVEIFHEVESEINSGSVLELGETKFPELDQRSQRRLLAVASVRESARALLNRPNVAMAEAYLLSLFILTAKHLEYLARDIIADDESKAMEPCVVHALISAYVLASKLENTVVNG